MDPKSKYWICSSCAKAKGWEPPDYGVSCFKGDCAYCDAKDVTLTATYHFRKPGNVEPLWG